MIAALYIYKQKYVLHDTLSILQNNICNPCKKKASAYILLFVMEEIEAMNMKRYIALSALDSGPLVALCTSGLIA